ncbi:MAG TPA: protein phosphatase 2C domain-containing protein [Streptosporangiaceae bacterium]|nr:protein phosphatase 2C domain-containing protein [Streptosporangiaceae bacterium]
MQVELSTDPGSPGRPNEDFAAIAPGVAVLLDGAGTPAGRDSGCTHGVAWFARTVGGLLLTGAQDRGVSLTEALGTAIRQVASQHSGTCDLKNPCTPSATVLVARAHGSDLEYLILADSVMLFQLGEGEFRVMTDPRLDEALAGLRPDYRQLPPGSPEREAGWQHHVCEVYERRNQPGGYWVAAADPAAAEHAIAGTAPLAGLDAVALLSDGAGRLADRYGRATWPEIGGILSRYGPAEAISRLRAVEAADPLGSRWPRTKIRDDATIVYWRIC